MKKIILWAVAIVVLSQGLKALNNSYPEGGFVAASRREEVFALVPTRGDDVANALRAEVPACLEQAAKGPFSPLAAEMFGEVTASLPKMPSAQAGKLPSDDEISTYQNEHSAELVLRFEPAVLALTDVEFAAFQQGQTVIAQNAPKILQCVFDAAHRKLVTG